MSIIKNFPSAADLDLDMWEFMNGVSLGRQHRPYRTILTGSGTVRIGASDDAQRDTTARRIEMLGDLYDTLREQTERARQAGLDISQALRVMSEFVAPKPFSPHDENGEG